MTLVPSVLTNTYDYIHTQEHVLNHDMLLGFVLWKVCGMYLHYMLFNSIGAVLKYIQTQQNMQVQKL